MKFIVVKIQVSRIGQWRPKSMSCCILNHQVASRSVFCFLFFLLYNTVLVLPYSDMNPPWVYLSSQFWTTPPPLSPYHLSGGSYQWTSPKHPVSCFEPRLVIRFLHDSIHVSMPFSQTQMYRALSFRIWNSSTGIPSPPLALFVVMLPKAHLTSHSRMSGSSWVIRPSWLSGSWRSFLYSSSVLATFLFLGLQNHCRWWLQAMKLKDTCTLEEKLWST